MGDFTKPIEDITREASEYVDMKIDDMKLMTVKGLSVAMNELVAVILILSVATIFLIALAFGLVLLLGDIIGSYAAGAFIVAGIFLALLIVLFCVRKKLFLNSFLKLFLGLFFSEDENIRES